MKLRKMFLLALGLTVINGCAESSALIKANSTSIRTDIFEELASDGVAPKGFCDLHITSTFKTHKPGIYSASDIHGTPDYKLLVNIGGQAVLLQGSLRNENSDPIKLVDPEAGDGVRYRFSKNLRLKTGTHKVVVALPDDEIAVAREIVLTDGKMNHLVVEPAYSSAPGQRRPGVSTTSFKEGIRTIRITLNGQDL